MSVVETDGSYAVSGAGFASNTSVFVTINGASSVAVSTDGSGAWSFAWTPDGAGTYTFRVYEQSRNGRWGYVTQTSIVVG